VEAAYKASHELSAPVEGVVAAISAWLVGDEAVRPYIETAALKLPLVLFEGRRLFVVRPETLQWPDVFTFKLGDELKVKMIHGSALPTPVRLLVQGGVEIPLAHPEVETLIDRSDLAGVAVETITGAWIRDVRTVYRKGPLEVDVHPKP
jgi:hypothetical protein